MGTRSIHFLALPSQWMLKGTFRALPSKFVARDNVFSYGSQRA